MLFRLPATFATHALLGSLVAQSECGDVERTPTYDEYLRSSRMAPVATERLLEKICDLHSAHK
jgi:hypothetical protein